MDSENQRVKPGFLEPSELRYATPPSQVECRILEGEVSYIHKDGSLTLQLVGGANKVQIVEFPNLPYRIGDWLRAEASMISESKFRITEPLPLVSAPMDERNIKRIFFFLIGKAGGASYKVDRCYQMLAVSAREMNLESKNIEDSRSLASSGLREPAVTPASLLTKAAFQWHSFHVPSSLRLFNPILEERQCQKILQWWYSNFVVRRLYLLGMSKPEVVASPFNPIETFDLLTFNPYLVPSFPVEKADLLALKLKLYSLTPDDRSCGIILREVFNNQSQRGWSCTPVSVLNKKFLDFPRLRDLLLLNYRVEICQVEDDKDRTFEALYLCSTLRDEILVSEYLISRLCLPDLEYKFQNEISRGSIIDCRAEEALDNFQLDPYQKQAIEMAIKGGVSIITGGPGSGKTSTLKYLVQLLQNLGISYMLASFTGKAVARIKEVVKEGRPPATLDRMCHSPSSFSSFKVLIVDEASMVTTELIARTLRTFGTNFAMVLVGDAHQLPPIGWGSFFNQLLLSSVVPCTYLRENHRTYQVEQDGILLNISQIPNWRDGLPFPFYHTENFCFFEGNENTVIELVQHLAQQGRSPGEFKIICPFNQYLPQINTACQLLWNGRNPSIKLAYKTWYLGDMVICKENNYDAHVMNGEEGRVIKVENESFTVDFGAGRHVKISAAGGQRYRSTDWDPDREDDAERNGEMTASDIELAYALTVHKSQGSEYEFVIFLMPPGNKGGSSFLTRNLVYTGISRAKRALYHIGDKMKSSVAIGQPLPYRHEYMASRLRKVLPIRCQKQEQIVLSTFNQVPEEFMDEGDFFME